MSHSQIPHLFAVVRTQSIRGPSFQFLEAHRIRQRDHSSIYTISSPQYDLEDNAGVYEENTDAPRGIHILRYYSARAADGRTEVVEHKFWYLPFILRHRNEIVPIIEFQYKSWLPPNFHRVAIRGNPHRFMRMYEDMTIHMMDRLREEEDQIGRRIHNTNTHFYDYHFRRSVEEDDFEENIFPVLRTPPRTRRHRYNDVTTTTTSSRRGAGVEPTNTVETVRVLVTETQYQALPLPKPVATLILANARQGEDNCPISATPYKDCSKLAVCSCFHVFDSESIEKWKAERNICPVCRTNIVNLVTEE